MLALLYSSDDGTKKTGASIKPLVIFVATNNIGVCMPKDDLTDPSYSYACFATAHGRVSGRRRQD
jgi:hypothetical protein